MNTPFLEQQTAEKIVAIQEKQLANLERQQWLNSPGTVALLKGLRFLTEERLTAVMKLASCRSQDSMPKLQLMLEELLTLKRVTNYARTGNYELTSNNPSNFIPTTSG